MLDLNYDELPIDQALGVQWCVINLTLSDFTLPFRIKHSRKEEYFELYPPSMAL